MTSQYINIIFQSPNFRSPHQQKMSHPTASFSLGRLFQSPRKWTPEHLSSLNIQEHRNVPVIVGDMVTPTCLRMMTLVFSSPSYLPCLPLIWPGFAELDFPDFASLAGEFSSPTKDDIRKAKWSSAFEGNLFRNILKDIA